MNQLHFVDDEQTRAVAFGATVRAEAERTESLATKYELNLIDAAYNSLDERVWDATDELVDLIGRGARYLVRSAAAREVERMMGGGL